MNKQVWLVGLVVVAIVASWQLIKQSQVCVDETVIIVGTNAEYPPFTWVKDGQIVGLDIDIVNEVGKRLGKKIKFIDMAFGLLIPQIQAGAIQVIAAGLTPTHEKAQQVLFTKPYIVHDPLVIITLVHKELLATAQSLAGKTVLVNEGYTADLWLSKQQGVTIFRVDSPATAFMALLHERADAFVTAASSVQLFFEQYGSDQFHVVKLPDVFDQYALAVAKEQVELHAHIEAALSNMHDDGTITQIKQKWGWHD